MADTTRREVLRYQGTEATPTDDLLVTEAPLEIQIDGTPIAVVMRTPGHDEDLVRGFALTEAIVDGPSDIVDIVPVGESDGDSRYDLRLESPIDTSRFQRNFYATSSCGVCGKASIDAVRIAGTTPPQGPQMRPALVSGLPETMRTAQPAFATTGGLHAAALFDSEGELLIAREDIGRHNAVDKVIGAAAPDAWPIGERILMVSGRISFEVAQKAAVAGIPVIGAVSAASSLAVELADELGMTVIGFIRDDGFNVYCGAHRIVA